LEEVAVDVLIARLQMDSNATDPFLFAMQHYQSADIIELCRIFVLDIYMKHYGKSRAFAYLERKHERGQQDTRRAIEALLLLFATTWFLGSPVYNLVAGIVLSTWSLSRHFIQPLASLRRRFPR